MGTSLARTTRFGYDAAGNQVSVTDALDHATTYSFDKLDRVETVTDARSGVVTVGYDQNGNTAWLTDATANKTQWTYDDAQRLTAETDPLGKALLYGYDKAGNVTSATDRLGRRRDFTYDAAGRVTAEDWYALGGAKVQTQAFGYDADSNLTSASDPDGGYTLSYDKLNRPVTVGEPYGLSLAFEYDKNGNRTKATDNKGGVQTSTYDGLDRLTAREQAGMARVVWGYDAKGDPTTLTRSGWVGGAWQAAGTTTSTFDDLGRATSIRHASAANATLAQYGYGYDAADRLTSETIDGVTRTYAYDDTNQLTSDNGTLYSFDQSGNRTNAGYATTTGNRMTSDGTWTYTYDAEGRVTKKSRGASAETWTYGYDHRGQMTSASKAATDGGAATATVGYSFDAFGNRLQRQTWDAATGTATERFAYDGWDTAKPPAVGSENFDVYVDLDGANSVTARRVYGGGFDEPVARQGAGGAVGWYGADRMGSVRAVFDNAGAITGTRDYSAYGRNTGSSGTGLDRYAYTGREWDAGLSLYYVRDRLYSADAGRFLQEDPIGLGADANLFRYVGNAVTMFTDPSGLKAAPLCGPGAPTGGSGGGGGSPPAGGGASNTFKNLFALTPVGSSLLLGDMLSEAVRSNRLDNQVARRQGREGPSLARTLAEQGEMYSDEAEKGLKTGAKALGNAGYDMAQSQPTLLGAVLPDGDLIPVTDEDRAAGYDTSKVFHRVGLEVGSLAVGGWAGSAGKVTKAWTAAEGFLGRNIHGRLSPGRLHDTLAGAAQRLGFRVCFAAGTPLRTPEGSKPVEALRPGDLVLSRDETDPTGEVMAKAVEEVFVREGLVWHLHVGGQVIRTTAEHPFYAHGRGWVACHELAVGDWLLGEDGRWLPVEDLLDTGEWETVYNLRVADHHTYFVGSKEWGFALWAHNSYGPLRSLLGADAVLAQHGRVMATRAKDLLTKVGLTRAEQGATTVAVGRVMQNGRLVEQTVINGGAPASAVGKIRRLAPDAIQAPGGMHAETYLYLLNGGRANVSGIGVSHWKGPCSELCAPFFTGRGFNNIWWFGFVR